MISVRAPDFGGSVEACAGSSLWSSVALYYGIGRRSIHTDAETDERMFFCWHVKEARLTGMSR
jgi:hypothetical protein